MKFKDVFENGMNIDSPTFDVAYNTEKGESGSSSAEIGLKIYYEIENPTSGMVTQADINNVRKLAYQVLVDNNKLFLYWEDDYGYRNTLRLKSISAKPIEGTDVWDVTCKYSDKNSDDTTVEMMLKNFQFSTQGNTAHITRSLYTTSSANISGYVYNFENLIGWNDGEVAGVDVKRPNLTFQRDIWIIYSNLDFNLIRCLAEFTGSVNEDDFYGFYPGTVLFTGVSQGQQASLKVGEVTIPYFQITLGFEVSPNTYVSIGDYQVMKRGWDYLWYLFEKTTLTSNDNGGGKIVVKKPIQANVEQVYPYRTFCDFFGFGYTSNLWDGESFFNA